MPITASLGALSYSRFSSNIGNWDYYAIISNSWYTNSIVFDSTNNYYVLGAPGVTNTAPVVFKITQSPVPVISWAYQYSNANTPWYISGGIYYNNNSNLLSWCAGRATTNDGTYIPTIVTIDPETGIIINSNAEVRRATTGLSGGSFSVPIQDSSNNFYITNGDQTSTANNRSELTRLSKLDKISYDGSNPTLLGSLNQIEGANTDQMSGSSLILDNSDYPYIVYSVYSGTPKVFSTVIIKYDKTPNGTGRLNPLINKRIYQGTTTNPQSFKKNSAGNLILTTFVSNAVYTLDTSLNLIWGNTIPTGFVLGSCALDSLDNIYVTSLVTGGDNYILLYKFNNSGSLIFTRKLSMAGYGLSPRGVHINNDIMYINGAINTITSGLIIKLPIDGSIPGTGNYSFSGGFAGILSYSSYSATSSGISYTPTAYGTGTGGTYPAFSSGNIDYTANTVTLYRSSIT